MADQYQSREERKKNLQTSGNPKKVKKKSGGVFKKIFLTLVALGIVGILGGVGAFAYMVKDAPKLDPKLLKDPIPSKILDKNGNTVTEIGPVNREYVNYNEIPKQVENAVLATEDYRFYQHHGIDWVRLGGAVLANFQHGFGSEGGSTITQQVVKNAFLTQQKTLSRKVQEAWLAYQLEQKYTKHQIFEMYVNKVYVSENSYGLATAAKIYYGKSLAKLDLSEAAQLAGMPQSPNNYNPFTHPDLAEKRRNIVLSLMYQHGFITKQQMDDAEKNHVKDDVLKQAQRTVNEKPYDSFIDEVINEVKDKTDFDINTDGLTIYTTLDKNAQEYVYKLLNTNEIIDYPDNKFQAGITLLDTKTGEIRAIGGGRNQQVKYGFNYAIDAQRQPGSTIKPILDYGPAIENLNWGTYHEIDDKPVTYSTGKQFGNWDQRYMGPMTMRTALQLSRNSPAVQTLQQVGLDKAKQFANNLGIPLKEIYESYAIGGLKTGVSTLEMAGAYSAFGNSGIYIAPHAVTKVQLRDGTIIDLTPQPKVVMKDSTAFMITDMLKSVLVSPGTGVRASVPGLPIAGKTGTTNYTPEELSQYNIPSSTYVPDAWFTGYTTNFTASIWTGYPDRKTPISAGSNQRIAQLIFKNLMAYVSDGINTPDFKMPNSVEPVRIEKGTMPPELASDNTPDSDVLTEYAVKGYAPTSVSDKYSKMDAPSNLTAKYDDTKKQIMLTWNYNSTSNSNVQFDVSIDNGTGAKHVTQTTNSLTIPANPGDKYTFTIVAISGDKKSDPASTSIEVPKTAAGTGNTTGTTPGNKPPGNTNGTGTGNGTNTGTGTGNGSGNGSGPSTGTGSGTGTGTNGNNGSNPGGSNGGTGGTSTPPTTEQGTQSGSSPGSTNH
ncbi:PBP1A family penicillin-binding protein [Bacillus sp. BRMEA1]|uniref:penicillin-binding protein 1A n=1 Tax=Neobacillus endophyticus TaxID=2738405 RepID=UPI001566C3E2|nr:penicillin-binding protein 1A [Neobacillus endophyticus]NRD80539.1 PBP1A family penicillin-binding protein [Neobacillus endophyticus]